jgi:PD-(D/E)XK nuclease superfamily
MLIQCTSEHTGKRIYTCEEGFRYPSISTLANFFGSTIGLYKWNLKLGKQIAAEQGLENLTDRELYLLGKPEGDRICKESADLGTEVHRCIELNELSGNEEYDAYVEQYHRHIAPHLEILHQEIVLGHVTPEGLRFAGTCDLIGKWKGETIIGDWKTSPEPKKKAFMGKYALQLAAYAIASPEQTDKGIIFNLQPNKVTIFHIPLELAKDMLLSTVLPSFYEYFRIHGHSLPCNRPWPNQFRNLGKISDDYERSLAKLIEVE